MDDPVLYEAGDKVQVWLGRGWVNGVVVGHFRWSHYSGNSFVCYQVDLGAETPLNCGRNSLRPRGRKKRVR